jgi:tetrahydromethanopterin S-methyltransferase subunit A
MKTKQQELDDIKRLTSIKVSDICKRENINKENLYHSRTSIENIRLIKQELIKELKECIKEIEIEDKGLKYTYDIVKNDYTGEYRVFENNEEHFIARVIYCSHSKKDCLEYLKSIK